MPKIEVRCLVCHQSFLVYRYDYEVRYRKYCSAVCQARSAKLTVPDRDTLIALYHVRNLSTNQLADHYGVSKGTIYNWMKALEVPTRSLGQAISIAQTGRPASESRKSAIGRAQKGKKKSPEAVEKMRAALTGRKCAPLSDEHRRRLSESKRGIPLSSQHRAAISATRSYRISVGLISVPKPSQGYSRFKRGYRDDIRVYVRSSWEANYARFLSWRVEKGEIIRWEYEPYTFVFSGVSRGVVSYLPDFRVTHLDGSIEFIEVKGRETSRDRTKWARMKKFYPHIKLTVVGADAYKSLQSRFGGLPYWEH